MLHWATLNNKRRKRRRNKPPLIITLLFTLFLSTLFSVFYTVLFLSFSYNISSARQLLFSLFTTYIVGLFNCIYLLVFWHSSECLSDHSFCDWEQMPTAHGRVLRLSRYCFNLTTVSQSGNGLSDFDRTQLCFNNGVRSGTDSVRVRKSDRFWKRALAYTKRRT